MATHTVQIGDGSGNSLNISVSISYFSGQGSWRALDLGYLKYTSGNAMEVMNSGSSTISDSTAMDLTEWMRGGAYSYTFTTVFSQERTMAEQDTWHNPGCFS